MKQRSTMSSVTYASYLWLDGTQPTQALRTKTRVLTSFSAKPVTDIGFFPQWSFDGSSTHQASGHDSDCLLAPVYFCPDPTRQEESYIVLCEVLTADGEPHPSNHRSLLRQELSAQANQGLDPWIGFEQEYTLFAQGHPLGWPPGGFPAPQGPYYCGIGAGKAPGRALAEAHLQCCVAAGLALYGINAEVMPGQWEFQVGYRGLADEAVDPLTIADQLWIARYFLLLLGEPMGVEVRFDSKPVRGDWNGAGMHTNFSTAATRKEGGLAEIKEIIRRLAEGHGEAIPYYGAGLADRLTGAHETCHIREFRSGISDRSASVRIPVATASQKRGYFEDRRPGANADPYQVARVLLASCH